MTKKVTRKMFMERMNTAVNDLREYANRTVETTSFRDGPYTNQKIETINVHYDDNCTAIRRIGEGASILRFDEEGTFSINHDYLNPNGVGFTAGGQCDGLGAEHVAVDGGDGVFSRFDWGEYGPAIRRWESVTRPAPHPVEMNRNGRPRLAAVFSEWMMGLPDGHNERQKLREESVALSWAASGGEDMGR